MTYTVRDTPANLAANTANLTTLMAGANAIQIVDFDSEGAVVSTTYDLTSGSNLSNLNTIVSILLCTQENNFCKTDFHLTKHHYGSHDVFFLFHLCII